MNPKALSPISQVASEKPLIISGCREIRLQSGVTTPVLGSGWLGGAGGGVKQERALGPQPCALLTHRCAGGGAKARPLRAAGGFLGPGHALLRGGQRSAPKRCLAPPPAPFTGEDWGQVHPWPACCHRAASGQGEAEDILFLPPSLPLGHRTLEMGTVRRRRRRQDLEKGGRKGLVTLRHTHARTRSSSW